MATGWGLQQWGLGPWGGIPASIDLESAVPIATRTVRVTLSREPVAVSAIGIGDALNPSTWQLVREDTGAAFTVLGASLAGEHEVDLLLLEPLAGFLVTHRVSTTTLRATSGGGADGAILFAEFPGMKSASSRSPGEYDRDLANPPVADAAGASQGFGGTLVVVGGDYATEQGETFIRKMALRDILTEPDSYSHLPGYGFGLGNRVKRGVRPSEISGLAADIARVLKSRPWIKDAKVTAALDESDGILYVSWKLFPTTGRDAIGEKLSVGQGGVVSFSR